MHSAAARGETNLHGARNLAEATERAQWLDELARAIAQAQWLTWRLGVLEGDDEDARALYGRLEAARSEVESLRFGDWINLRKEIDPKWIHGLNDSHALPDSQEI